MPDDVEYKGWVIEAQSYKLEGDFWRPHALAIIHEGRSAVEHHVSELPGMMCDTEQDANAYAVTMAKKWIDDRGREVARTGSVGRQQGPAGDSGRRPAG